MFTLATMPDPDERWWPDERKLVRELRARIAGASPPTLTDVSGSWEAPYLNLRFRGADGSVLEVLHGDGYTAIRGEEVDFHGGLSTDELQRVLFAMLDGTARYVVRRKVGLMMTEHFELPGDTDRIGIHTGGLLFLHRYALDKLLPVSARTSCVELTWCTARVEPSGRGGGEDRD